MNKLNKPTHACPIKVTNTSAPVVRKGIRESISADGIADKNNKTGKGTAVVAVMYLLNENKVNLHSPSSRLSDGFSQETVKKSNFFGKSHEISRKKQEKAENWQEKANGTRKKAIKCQK